jgi:hypothetical protein
MRQSMIHLFHLLVWHYRIIRIINLALIVNNCPKPNNNTYHNRTRQVIYNLIELTLPKINVIADISNNNNINL